MKSFNDIEKRLFETKRFNMLGAYALAGKIKIPSTNAIVSVVISLEPKNVEHLSIGHSSRKPKLEEIEHVKDICFRKDEMVLMVFENAKEKALKSDPNIIHLYNGDSWDW